MRIVGGTAVQIQSSPSTVYLQLQDSPTTAYRCNGSIIDSLHVVTTAYCLYTASGTEATPAALLVEAGISNLDAQAPTDALQSRSVTAIRIDPFYTPVASSFADDVAVLTLESPLDFSGPAVKAVALPAAKTPLPGGTPVSIAAFGRETFNVPPSGQLESMSATVEAQTQCGDYTGDTLFANQNSTVMCFKGSSSTTTCNEDGGAGVLTTGGTPTLVGIAISPTSGTCEIGGQNTFLYVAAPEILDFIEGSDSPPRAPRRTSSVKLHLDYAVPLRPGSKLTCSSTGWTTPVHITYAFSNESSGKILQATSARPTYVVKAKDVGVNILCDMHVTGSGGTLIVSPLSTLKVARK
ncbi:MAG TPA: trypsin-like serine protease [Gaiellaceae bacterium]|nr:trypsin-like serine protease [Gaiellaceae bacterium]